MPLSGRKIVVSPRLLRPRSSSRSPPSSRPQVSDPPRPSDLDMHMNAWAADEYELSAYVGPRTCIGQAPVAPVSARSQHAPSHLDELETLPAAATNVSRQTTRRDQGLHRAYRAQSLSQNNLEVAHSPSLSPTQQSDAPMTLEIEGTLAASPVLSADHGASPEALEAPSEPLELRSARPPTCEPPTLSPPLAPPTPEHQTGMRRTRLSTDGQGQSSNAVCVAPCGLKLPPVSPRQLSCMMMGTVPKPTARARKPAILLLFPATCTSTLA
jgi:hypothetical protein